MEEKNKIIVKIENLQSQILALKFEKYNEIPKENLMNELNSIRLAILNTPDKPNSKICHRSLSGPELRECLGKNCDRYNNCMIAWKRALLDRKTYGIPEEK